ncbi:uncharacterized protein TRAVEDRAFT_56320 [Trametes versicolor FP-101664 SS1]|uniref:uncharacterized protein n=1 Tax=Trametes versicolor (strain FP-101664) TaxID=717944 RepID=UPI00046242BF|nr:uncharacterized protein TRAVEDRAFT_56320 [Trametes versicolor FP-101664 SS1]EIW63246.1 hypothetical protein TRAVEDRAFT_56320 [Trametes versicolor FP-101664 SS1]
MPCTLSLSGAPAADFDRLCGPHAPSSERSRKISSGTGTGNASRAEEPRRPVAASHSRSSVVARDGAGAGAFSVLGSQLRVADVRGAPRRTR